MTRLKALLAIFSLLSILAVLSQSRAAEKKYRLSCPAAWPGAPAAKLSRLDFTADLYHYAPMEFDTDPSPYGADTGDELFCAYSNWRSLLITIPGAPEICYVVNVARKDPSIITDGYCVYKRVGDPAKDAVRVREMEPLDRSTSFFGVKLGMTRTQVAATMPPKSPSAPRSDPGQEIYVLKDTRQLVVNYNETKGAVIIELKPALGYSTGLADEMRERFGFPDKNILVDDWMVWRGRDGVRLFVPYNRRLGNWPFSDEYALLLDANALQDLDKELKLDDN